MKSCGTSWSSLLAVLWQSQLAQEGLPVNSKVVRRLMRSLDMQGKVGPVGHCTTDSQHDYPRFPNLDLEVQAPDEVWVAVILDLFTRSMRGWHLGRTLSHKLALTALEKAVQHHGAPTLHHSH